MDAIKHNRPLVFVVAAGLIAFRASAGLVAQSANDPKPTPTTSSSWDIDRCRRMATPRGHVCTPDHLDADLKTLAEQSPSNGDAIKESVLRSWAESGLVESSAEARRAQEELKRLETELYEPKATSSAAWSWRVTRTEPLQAIRSITIDAGQDRGEKCQPSGDDMRLAAARPLVDAGLKVVEDLTSPTLQIELTALSTRSVDGCVAFLRVSLTNYSYFAPSYQQANAAMGSLLLLSKWAGPPDRSDTHSVAVALGQVVLLQEGHLLTGTTSGFRDRITDQIRRSVDTLMTKIKLAQQ